MWDDLRERPEAGTLPEPFDSMYFAEERPMFELYDLETDPYEMRILAGVEEWADVELSLKQQLSEWMILQRDFLPLPTEG